MDFISLFGCEKSEILKEVKIIKQHLEANINNIFVYSGKIKIHDYIELASKPRTPKDADNLSDEELYSFKICYENKKLQIGFEQDNKKDALNSMSELIQKLNPDCECRIVVKNNLREDLAFIVQQLLYIQYPIEKVDILLAKEEQDARKSKRFMEKVGCLKQGCVNAINDLEKIKAKLEKEPEDEFRNKRLDDTNEALESCKSIEEQINKALEVEMKFAVAASKKTGKSVVVNCFIGEEIAPTSVELATPNNCIYTQSKDDNYYLTHKNKNDRKLFHTKEEINNAIGEEFRNAQNDKSKNFAIPDMLIEYANHGKDNNFSSFTIYDTAGPDAAGTDHKLAAYQALEECDVAIFAIDYGKYLTTSEAEYLKMVKEAFNSKNKFHSLLFALNKIDVRYNDANAVKSIIKTVDFIKNRLADIDEKYKDCIVFPTCSLEYFNALTVKNAGITELNESISIDNLKRLKMSRRDICELQWLHSHAENLEFYHGIDGISYNTFENDSGIPTLMKYVSYVAQSKAKEEIVNNVTFQIATQQEKLDSIKKYIGNIEKLISAEDSQIHKITDIIKNYRDNAKLILNEDIKNSELKNISDERLLKKFKGDYEAIIDYQKKAANVQISEATIVNAIYNTIVHHLFYKIQSCNKKDQIVVKKLDKLFTRNDFLSLVTKIMNKYLSEAAKGVYDQMNLVNDDVKKIITLRQKKLYDITQRCRESLNKENFYLDLPELPAFEFATKMAPFNHIQINIANDIDFDLKENLKDCFGTDWAETICRFLAIPAALPIVAVDVAVDVAAELFWGSELDQVKTTSDSNDIAEVESFWDLMMPQNLKADMAKFQTVCDKNLMKDCENIIYKNHIPDKIKKNLNKYVFGKYMTGLVDEIKEAFDSLNENYLECVKHFVSAVDDRDKYKANINNYKKHRKTINEIDEATKDFMTVWSEIVKD